MRRSLPRVHDLFDLTRLADFLVVHHADGHVFADFGLVGYREWAFVEEWEFAFAHGDEVPLHFAFDAAVDVHGFEAGLVVADFHRSAPGIGPEVGGWERVAVESPLDIYSYWFLR